MKRRDKMTKKIVASLMTATMVFGMTISVFADKTVTIHYQNTDRWNTVGAWVYQGIAFNTNVTPADKCIVSIDEDGRTKVLWPGAKMEEEGAGWYKTNVTFSDEVETEGMVMIFNNYVADSYLNETTTQADLDAIFASGIPTTATAIKMQSANILVNKKFINSVGGVGSDLYVFYDNDGYHKTFDVPDSYPTIYHSNNNKIFYKIENNQARIYEIDTENSYIRIPDSIDECPVTEIEAGTFSKEGINEIKIPKSVKKVGEQSFSVRPKIKVNSNAEIEGLENYTLDTYTEYESDGIILQDYSKRFTGTEIQAEKVSNNSINDNLAEKYSTLWGANVVDTESVLEAYDVKMMNSGVEIVPDTYVDLSIPCSTVSNEKYLYRISKDGFLDQLEYQDMGNRLECQTDQMGIFFITNTPIAAMSAVDSYDYYNPYIYNEVTHLVGRTKEYTDEAANISFKYKEMKDGTLCITGANITSDTIQIPDSIDGKKVTRIKGLNTYKELKKVILPDTITMIGHNCFENTELEEINFPKELRIIGSYAFDHCKLKNIELPNKLRSIGEFAFEGNSFKEVVFPNSFNELGICAFAYCDQLERVVFPGAPVELKIMNAGFFGACDKLREITLPVYVKGDVESLLGGHNSLKKVIIPETFSISSYTFNGCKSLIEAAIYNTVSQTDWCFADCTKLRKVYVSPSVTNLDANTFENCPNLVIYGQAGSYANSFADENGNPFFAENVSAANVSTYHQNYLVYDYEPEKLLGDVNHDGVVDSMDAVILKKYLANFDEIDISIENSDMDGDGEITSADAVLLLKSLI